MDLQKALAKAGHAGVAALQDATLDQVHMESTIYFDVDKEIVRWASTEHHMVLSRHSPLDNTMMQVPIHESVLVETSILEY